MSMLEKDCPVCTAPIRSSASETRFCAICGMGITKNRQVYSVLAGNERLFFCGEYCQEIYLKNHG